jgi:DNA repair exonuclease SbcCD ATPase subunit
LRVRHSDTERDLADRVEQLDVERDLLATAKARADAAEKALRDVQQRLDDVTAKSESVASTLDEVRAELAEATTQLENAGEGGGDAGALWALEIARSERRWQASVAPGMDLPSPFEQTDDALKLAVEVEASALREEVGTRIDVAWSLDADLPDQASLLVLRLAQELLADAASRAETLELRVGLEDDSAGVAVALRALDEEGSVVPVALPPLASGRVRPGEDGVWVVTRT